jgi:hypothetical protein
VGRRGGTGISPRYFTEKWREEIEFRKYEKTKFAPIDLKKSHPKQKEVLEIAKLIVKDMTEKFNLGLVVPLDAPVDYRG